MRIKLDKDTFNNCSRDNELKAADAELLIYKSNGKIEYTPAANVLNSTYKVNKLPPNDPDNGVKWIVLDE